MLLSVIAKSFFIGSLSVKLIMLTLFAISIAGFAAFLQKFTILKLNLTRIGTFETLFLDKSNLSSLIESNRHKPNNPLAFSLILLVDAVKNKEKVNAVANVIKVSQIETRQRLSYLEKYFAIFTAISPLLGLLGTVIGIIEVFESISSANIQSVTLNLIAPGISGALVTTILGIVVSVINSIFLSYCMAKRQIIEAKNNVFLYTESNKMINIDNLYNFENQENLNASDKNFSQKTEVKETKIETKETTYNKNQNQQIQVIQPKEEILNEYVESEDEIETDDDQTDDIQENIEEDLNTDDEIETDDDDNADSDNEDNIQEEADGIESTDKDKDKKNNNNSGNTNNSDDDYNLDEL